LTHPSFTLVNTANNLADLSSASANNLVSLLMTAFLTNSLIFLNPLSEKAPNVLKSFRIAFFQTFCCPISCGCCLFPNNKYPPAPAPTPIAADLPLLFLIQDMVLSILNLGLSPSSTGFSGGFTGFSGGFTDFQEVLQDFQEVWD
jgi:hypothetical protein